VPDTNSTASRYSWQDDYTISREHIRIHCILYEQDPIANIAPFVYATDLSANGTYLKKSNEECTGSQGRGILMGKNGTFLLDHGDQLQLSETVTLVYRSFSAVKQCALTATQEREKASLASRYLVTGRLLGEGGYGKVLIGIDQSTQRQLACKIVNLEKLYDRCVDLRVPTINGQRTSSQAINQLPNKVQSCFREFDILKELSHPNIVHVQKVFWSQSTIYMFQELVTGGDLFSYIEYKQGKIPSIESAVIVRQVLKGVEYLHGQDIVHRDLKPDNILMTSLNSGARVVITDFGNARFLPNADTQRDYTNNKLRRMFSIVGTLEYTAPEIHRANEEIPKAWGYSLSVDMWSIGSVTAAILTGEQIFSCRHGPYEEDARRVIVQLAAQCDLSILDDEHHPLWGPIAPAPKDFIKRLLVLNEKDRMSATEALHHIWFTHPMMAAEFEAQYERSIRDWRPRRKDDQLIEQISTWKPASTPVQPVRNIPTDGTASRFFSHQRALIPESLTDDLERAYEPQRNEQFASQPEPSVSADASLEEVVYTHGDENEYRQLGGDYDAAPCWASDEQQAYSEPGKYNDPALRSPGTHRNLAKGGLGQLQCASTTTRGRYFQREIVDLDDLDAPLDDKGDDYTHPHPLRREETIQARKTSSADSEAHEGVDQWWHHRYPRTQYHYDTYAEPISQEEDEILVQETPPEVFLNPQRPKARDPDWVGHALKQPQGHRPVLEPLSANKVSKPRRVYGRQR
jgi:serine/threonine protein kinase